MPKGSHLTCGLWFIKKPFFTRATLCTCLPDEKQLGVPYFSVLMVLQLNPGEASWYCRRTNPQGWLTMYHILREAHCLISFNAQTYNYPYLTERRLGLRNPSNFAQGTGFELGTWVLEAEFSTPAPIMIQWISSICDISMGYMAKWMTQRRTKPPNTWAGETQVGLVLRRSGEGSQR